MISPAAAVVVECRVVSPVTPGMPPSSHVTCTHGVYVPPSSNLSPVASPMHPPTAPSSCLLRRSPPSELNWPLADRITHPPERLPRLFTRCLRRHVDAVGDASPWPGYARGREPQPGRVGDGGRRHSYLQCSYRPADPPSHDVRVAFGVPYCCTWSR